MIGFAVAIATLALITLGDRLANWSWDKRNAGGVFGVLIGVLMIGIGLTVITNYSEKQGAIKHANGEIVVSVVNGEHVAVRKESK